MLRGQSLLCSYDPGPDIGVQRAGGHARQHQWQKPARGRVKFNVDAAVSRDKVASFGCVARDADGAIMAAASAFPTTVLSATLGEALCLRWAMVLATQLGF